MERSAFVPMGIGGILDKAIKLYRQNFLRFITIIAVIYIPILIITLLAANAIFAQVQNAANDSDKMIAVAILGVVMWLLALLAQTLCTAALIKGISQSYLGKKTSVGETYRSILPRSLTIVFAAFLVTLTVFGGILLCIIPGIIFSFWFILTTQTIVIEKVGIIEGMSRSKKLVSGNLGKIFLLSLVVGIIGYVVQQIFGFIGGFFTNTPDALTYSENPELITTYLDTARHNFIITTLFENIGQIIVMPITAGAFVLLYYDLRIRKEGFDLDMLAQAMGEEVPAAEETPTYDSQGPVL